MATDEGAHIAARPAGQPAPEATGVSPAPPAPGRVLTEFEHLLLDGRCPMCLHLAEAERGFFSWFENENYSSPELQHQIRAGMGMCPTHSRHSVDQLQAGPVMSIITREALAGVLQRLRGEGSPGSCVVCGTRGTAGEYISQVIAGSLRSGATARLYGAHTGMCLPHVMQVASVATPQVLKLVVKRLHVSLCAADGDPLVHLLAGADDDAARRSRWRGQLPAAPSGRSTLERVAGLLATGACPVCLAGGLGEQRYLLWLGERDDHHDASAGSDPGELCPAHTHDLALTAPGAARDCIERKRAAVVLRLEQLLERIDDLPEPGGRRRSRAEAVTRAVAILRPLHECPACQARRVIEQSELELLAAATGLDAVRRLYEESHGLCVRHALHVPADALAQMARRQAEARTSLLAWEVNETARKYAWQYRHEPPGPEQGAWLRALAHIDGRVFLGGPAAMSPRGSDQVMTDTVQSLSRPGCARFSEGDRNAV